MAGPDSARGAHDARQRPPHPIAQFTVTTDSAGPFATLAGIRDALGTTLAVTVDATGDPNPVAVVAAFLNHDRRAAPVVPSAHPRTAVVRLEASRHLVVVTAPHPSADATTLARTLAGADDRSDDEHALDTSPIHLDTADARALTERAAHLGVTPASLLQSVWAVTLGHPTSVLVETEPVEADRTSPGGPSWLSMVVDHTDTLNARVGHHRDEPTLHHRDRLVAALLDGTVRSALRPEPPSRIPPPRPDPAPSHAPTEPDLTPAARATTLPDHLLHVLGDAGHAPFAERAHRIAGELAACGAGPGAVVAVAMRSELDRVLGIWAATESGAAVTVLDSDDPAERRVATLDACRAGWILTSVTDVADLADVAPWLPRLPLGDRELEESLARRRRGPLTDADRVAPLRPDAPAVVAHRPGVTTMPVTVTHLDLLHRLAAREAPSSAGRPSVVDALLATIDDLADPTDVVVRLADGDGSPAVFCIHPMMGLAWPYVELSRYLDPRATVWGVQTPALTDPDFLPATMADLVNRYVDEIVAVDPRGPYHLLGWSVGGVLAHAIADAMAQRGFEVASVILLDPVHSLDPDSNVKREQNAALFGDADRRPADADTLGPDELGSVWRSLGGDQLPLTDVQARVVTAAMLRVYELVDTHVPPTIDADVLLIDSTVTAAELMRSSEFWSSWCTGHLRTAEVSFRHGELMSSEALAEVGPLVAAHLASVSSPA
ncbi:thioesterase domain-containing protein [Rhodococcus sp. NPDC003994]